MPGGSLGRTRRFVGCLCDRQVAGGAGPRSQRCVDLRRMPAHGPPADSDRLGEQPIAHEPVDRAGWTDRSAPRPTGGSTRCRVEHEYRFPCPPPCDTAPVATGRDRSQAPTGTVVTRPMWATGRIAVPSRYLSSPTARPPSRNHPGPTPPPPHPPRHDWGIDWGIQMILPPKSGPTRAFTVCSTPGLSDFLCMRS